MDKLPDIASALRQVRAAFENGRLAEAAVDARVLLAGLLELSSTDLIIQDKRLLTASEWERVCEAIDRRLAGEPVYRILGVREFYGLPFALSKDTLEPRQDTEILVDTVLDVAGSRENFRRILDLGIGTGAIILSLLHELPNARGVGADISADAVKTARKNAEQLGLSQRFDAVVSNWFENIDGVFDIIVSNPPYIESGVVEGLTPEVRQYDPIIALDGGPDGLAPYRIIAGNAADYLVDTGQVAVEIGWKQKESVSAIFAEEGFTLRKALQDLAGNDRVLLFGRR